MTIQDNAINPPWRDKPLAASTLPPELESVRQKCLAANDWISGAMKCLAERKSVQALGQISGAIDMLNEAWNTLEQEMR